MKIKCKQKETLRCINENVLYTTYDSPLPEQRATNRKKIQKMFPTKSLNIIVFFVIVQQRKKSAVKIFYF